MNIKSILGIILIIVGAALFVNVIIEPLLAQAGVDQRPIWLVVDLLVVAGLIVAFVSNYRRKRAHDAAADGSITREYVEVNLLFWGVVAAAIWFVPIWFQFMMGSEDFPHMMWIVADTFAVLILLTTGLHLMRSASND